MKWRSMLKYATIAVALLLAGILAIGIIDSVNAQVVSAPVQVSGGGGGSFVSAPVYGGYSAPVYGGYGPNQMVCYKNDPFGPLVCYNAPPNAIIASGGAVYRTPGGGIVQNAPFVSGGGGSFLNAPVIA